MVIDPFELFEVTSFELSISTQPNSRGLRSSHYCNSILRASRLGLFFYFSALALVVVEVGVHRPEFGASGKSSLGSSAVPSSRAVAVSTCQARVSSTADTSLTRRSTPLTMAPVKYPNAPSHPCFASSRADVQVLLRSHRETGILRAPYRTLTWFDLLVVAGDLERAAPVSCRIAHCGSDFRLSGM